METNEQKKRRLFGKQYLTAYLRELKKILKVDIDANKLLTIVETDEIGKIDFSSGFKDSSKILFNEKDKLKEIIFRDNDRINKMYYLFVSYSDDCGTLKINLLQDFNFDFSFEDEHVGLISFIREDLLEKIILDFTEESDVRYLEIETYKT